MNEIKIEEALLAGDIQTFEQILSQFAASYNQMMTKGDELHSVWTGPSKEAFLRQYQIDCDLLKEIQSLLVDMKAAMEYALKEYERCGRDMETVANGIPI